MGKRPKSLARASNLSYISHRKERLVYRMKPGRPVDCKPLSRRAADNLWVPKTYATR